MFCLPNDGVAGAVEMPIAAVVLRGLFLAVKIYFFAARFNDFHIFPLLLGAFVKNTLKRAAVAEAIKVDVRYALGQNHPFQIVAKIEQCLLYLASVRQNAGFEFAALAESRLFYQSNSVGNNDIFYVPPRKRVFADCGNGAVVWNFAFCSARQKRFGFFLCQAFARPAVNFVSALYRDCFEIVAARKNVIPDFFRFCGNGYFFKLLAARKCAVTYAFHIAAQSDFFKQYAIVESSYVYISDAVREYDAF